MIQVVEYVNELLWDIADPLGIDVHYEEAVDENIQLPYMVFDLQSDATMSKYSEKFTVTVNIWGVSEHFNKLDVASQEIYDAVVNRTLINACKSLTIQTNFISRMNLPVDDLEMRCKEVRFSLVKYRTSGHDTK
ncbi:hypothetical protein ABD81_11265 [Bacillus thuringiensis]|uniref:hypothetical protein n=1 Tax=Bacillus thuringiensis TaxID=1428 RepID=UPI000A3A0449|nr:hypothetical protein [Bacillus thuringiensis]OTZ84085.1 hypothetical protein BK771_22900 [Bacillus thuringiensis serovar ostriniae]MBG9748535.1 hypothetical protein [Bacillus thuringiensis]MBG9749467.1 hypothetical protein [Bacillus thuringiensis]MBG9778312.1 hypothetical protein [Bacillus thuringiensis]MBG9925459.1 hypothetical protein [Bacillus thuringiensis]